MDGTKENPQAAATAQGAENNTDENNSTTPSASSPHIKGVEAEAENQDRIVQAPDGWHLDKSGVYEPPESGKKGKRKKISGPTWVSALTRDVDGEEWGAVVHWVDRDGRCQERAFAFARFYERGNTVVQELAGGGLAIKPGYERSLTQYLASFDPRDRIRSVTRIGWIDTIESRLSFVLPNTHLGVREGEDVIFQPEQYSPTTRTIRGKGTLDDWREKVARLCRGNDLLVFSVCCGFAGALLKPAAMDGGGFHLYGTTSRGKTTCLQVAASVFGCGVDPAEASAHSYVRGWYMTGNAAEAIAAAHNDGILCLDEVGTCTAEDFGAIAYLIAGGQGKAAMTANRSLQRQRNWRVMVLSTGEISVRQEAEETGRAAKGGQLVRLMDIPASRIVNDPQEMPAATFIETLKRNSSQHFGVAGPEFVRQLIVVGHAQALRSEVSSMLDVATDELAPKTASPEQRRAIRRLALVKVAGILAAQWMILPFGEADVARAVETVRDLWLEEGAFMSDADRGVQALRDFILSEQHRIPEVKSGRTNRSVAGYNDRKRELYLLLRKGFGSACGGHDPKEVAKVLERRGLLFKNEKDRLMSKHEIGGYSRRLRVYAVRHAILDEDSDQPGATT